MRFPGFMRGGLRAAVLTFLQVRAHRLASWAVSINEMWANFDLVGKWFGNYRAVQFIKEGGLAGSVYAHDPFLNRYVAVVLFPSRQDVDSDFLWQVERKTQLLRNLTHANILPIYDRGYAHGYFYTVTDLSTAPALSDGLKQAPLPVHEAGDVLRRVASAVDTIHEKKIFHGDIKPANVLLDRPGHNVWLTRLGISDFVRTGSVGTLLYMAPELFEGQPIDARAEIYSVGVLAFEILSGRTPFKGDLKSLVDAHRGKKKAPPLETLCPNLPKRMSAAVGRALCADRAARFSTASEFANEAWPDRDL